MDVNHSRGRGMRIALAISVSLNIVLIGAGLWPDGEANDADVPSGEVATAASNVKPVEAESDDTPEAAAAEAGTEAGEEAEVAEAEDAKAAEPAEGEVLVASAKVEGSIPQTMAVAAAPYGDFVSATLSRLLVWDHDLRRDLRAGDQVEVAWSLGTTDTVVIEAASFFSQKFNRTMTAYRFKADGDEYASYWSADGTEVPHRLKNSPLDDYEQITSLLKDRPDHAGMDFKVPVGTEVLATSPGVVTRSNWNWKYNGNCLEVRHDDGVLAKYLHLSENRVKPGERVKPGQVIALSGNTGRSTGPHLHYQLNRGAKVVDPIDYHGTIRRTLPASDKDAFSSVVQTADERFEAARTVAAN